MVSYMRFVCVLRVLLLSLNPCCSGRWSRTGIGNYLSCLVFYVLILVVVEDGLVHMHQEPQCVSLPGLNPCCSGRWSRTPKNFGWLEPSKSLNPCCSGRWSRTSQRIRVMLSWSVLILVVVEDGLVRELVCLFTPKL